MPGKSEHLLQIKQIPLPKSKFQHRAIHGSPAKAHACYYVKIQYRYTVYLEPESYAKAQVNMENNDRKNQTK